MPPTMDALILFTLHVAPALYNFDDSAWERRNVSAYEWGKTDGVSSFSKCIVVALSAIALRFQPSGANTHPIILSII